MTKDRTKTLREFGADLEAVHFYRSRLDCAPPFPAEAILKKCGTLDKLFKKVEAAQMACNRLAAEIHFLGVPVPVWDGGRNPCSSGDGDGLDTFEWHPMTGEWGYREPDRIYGRITAEYVNRPDKLEAVRIWNTFLVAFERTPVRLFHVRADGYFIEFRDAQERLIRFHGDALKGRHRPEPIQPIHEFMEQLYEGASR
jgi:hypothetical protein